MPITYKSLNITFILVLMNSSRDFKSIFIEMFLSIEVKFQITVII
jgi:hypothetical protein